MARDWQLSAAEQQQSFYNQFGDRQWDSVPKNDTSTLNTKISFSLYSTTYERCSTEQKDAINATRKKMLELCGSGNVYFGCVFVNVLPKNTRESSIVPLIRTKQTYGEDIYFIEAQPGRVYTGWTDFLENNKLPECNMCYPVDGFYGSRFNGRVNIQFGESPGTSVVTVILDIASSIGKTASAGLLAVSVFFPLATPFVITAGAVLGTSAAYSTTRNIIELVDRDGHHESIGLKNEQARDIWLGMGVDVIGSVLMGGAAALPRLVASGRIATSMASVVMDVLNWVSIGVNSFGVLVNVAVLIGKLRNNTLEPKDILYFISSCLFISNIVINAAVAENVIQTLSNRPSQIVSIFKMISNTLYNMVKTISVVVTSEAVIETICGKTLVSFLRHFGMNHTAQALQIVRDLLGQFRRGVLNVLSLCFGLQKLLVSHLWQVLDEVGEAWKKTRAIFNTFSLPEVQNLFNKPTLHGAEILNSVERVLDDADLIEPEERDITREELMRAGIKIASDMNAQTEREFAQLFQIAMNDIRRRCDRRMVLGASEYGHLLPKTRVRVLQEAIKEFGKEFEANAEILERNKNTLENSELPILPLTTWEDFDVHVFQITYRVPTFDQFVYDAACHLLDDEDFLNRYRIDMGDGPVIMIQSLVKTLIFYYKPLRNTDSAIGLILLQN